MKSLVAFFEIPAADFERAVKFYENVLDLKLAVMDGEKEKMAFFPEQDGTCPGAISFTAGFDPSPSGVLVSLSVDNMDAALSRIGLANGKVVKEKTKIEAEGMGYFALFRDSEGNTVGLYSDN